MPFNVYCDAANDDDAGERNLFYDDASAAIIVFPSLILSIGLAIHSGLKCTATKTFAIFALCYQTSYAPHCTMQNS